MSTSDSESDYTINFWCIGDEPQTVTTIVVKDWFTVSQLKKEIGHECRWTSLPQKAMVWKVNIPPDDIYSYVTTVTAQPSDSLRLSESLQLKAVFNAPPPTSFLHLLVKESGRVPVKSTTSRKSQSTHGRPKRGRDTESVEDSNEIVNIQLKRQRLVDAILIGPTPSDGAKSTNYRKIQSKNPIYDGRYDPDSPTPTTAPSITLFHPIFASFSNDLADADLPIPQETLAATANLMEQASGLHKTEALRKQAISASLSLAIGHELSNIVNSDRTTPDSGIKSFLGPPINEFIALAVNEDKREIGDGGSDPAIQAGLSMCRLWSQADHTTIREATCCPTFLLATCGPWLRVLGAVFTDKVIVQGLTAMIPIGVDLAGDETCVHSAARVLHVLGRNLTKLKQYYESLPAIIDSKRARGQFLFPSINCYYDDRQKKTINFDYIKALETDPACVTFLAQNTCSEQIVVKFVQRYGVDVHKFLAGGDFAPKLFYYGPICGQPGSPTYTPYNMVVMEYLTGETFAQDQASQSPVAVRQTTFFTALRHIINLLHDSGFVYGDLRPPNIMLMSGKSEGEIKVKLIDFDWAGKAGTVRYPYFLSQGIKWPSGVVRGGLIEQAHDLAMFDNLYERL